MRNTKSAFTLVELIVVITILAILGTIAFISLQGYSADARNSKRTSDIGNIQSAISLKSVEWVPLLSFIGTSSNVLGSISLAWTGATAAKYAAGTPNYTVLNVVKKDFLDPKGDNEYRIGASKQAWGIFQVATTMEQGAKEIAKVNGTFAPRDTTTQTITIASDWDVLALDDSSANFFKVGDTVTLVWGSAITTTIKKVSRDGVTITLNADATTLDTTMALSNTESDGLVADQTVATGAVLDSKVGWYLPY